MSPILIAIIASLLAGGGLGVGGTLLLTRDKAPEAIAATATVVDSAVREDVTDAETRAAVATSPAVNLAVAAAVQPGAAPSTVALAGYALAASAAMGKEEGASAFQVKELTGLLIETVKAMDSCPEPVPNP